jgi:hypothetical protein
VTARLAGVEAITFDFGGTLIHVDRAGIRAAAVEMARAIAAVDHVPVEAVLDLWSDERDRQFREEVPRSREVDLEQRVARVLDDAARRSAREERQAAVSAYSRGFLDAIRASPDVGDTLARLAPTRRLGILSNWPLASIIDAFSNAPAGRPRCGRSSSASGSASSSPTRPSSRPRRPPSASRTPRPSSTWAMTGQPMSSGRSGPAGVPRSSRTRRRTRRSRRARATPRWPRISSSPGSPSSRTPWS